MGFCRPYYLVEFPQNVPLIKKHVQNTVDCKFLALAPKPLTLFRTTSYQTCISGPNKCTKDDFKIHPFLVENTPKIDISILKIIGTNGFDITV